MRTKMKMALVSTVTLFLLCCSVVASGDNCNEYREMGKTVTLPMTVTENVSRFKWSFKEQTIIHRIGDTIVTQRDERVDIHKNGSLILKNLKKSDEGIYKPETYDKDGKGNGNAKQIHLCVLDSVKVPKMTMKCVDSENVKFTCTPDPKDKVTKFEWLKNSKKYEGKSKELTMLAKTVEEDSFSCIVFNQVSSQTSDAVKQSCVKAGFSFPEELFGISIWIFVGGGGAIVLVLIIIVILCCIRTRRKKRMRMMDAEEMRLAWGQTDQQRNQHPAHNHSHGPHPHDFDYENQQQGAGHTGPRQHRPRNQRPRAPDPTEGHPNPMPRRGVQAPIPPKKDDDEQPPPLPQPRKKAQKIQKV